MAILSIILLINFSIFRSPDNVGEYRKARRRRALGIFAFSDSSNMVAQNAPLPGPFPNSHFLVKCLVGKLLLNNLLHIRSIFIHRAGPTPYKMNALRQLEQHSYSPKGHTTRIP